MKLQYHKIPRVDMDVCTAEQMIAYNIASRYLDCNRKFSGYADAAQWMVQQYKRESENTRYNIDAIFCALIAGLESFVKGKYHILTSYKEVGEMFPANYR